MDATRTNRPRPLRIVTFNVRADAYRLVADWAARHGHTLALLVTTPGPPARRSTMYRETIAVAPPGQEIHVTTRPKGLVSIVVAAAPDLIISASFPYRIPPEVVAIPRLGAVNLHPAPLPRYRGPNPIRQIYDGEPTLGAALHRIAPEFDAGPILSLHTRPLPADLTPRATLATLGALLQDTLEDGLARVVAGEPGVPQDEAGATYGGEFTEEEHWLDWRASRRQLQFRALALNLGAPAARATLDGQEHTIADLTPLPDTTPRAAPGTILARDAGRFDIAVGDGAVRIAVAPVG